MISNLVHLVLSLSISYPYLIEFHDFVGNIQEGMKHQMAGATQAQQGMTFQITNIYFLFFTMRTGPLSKCENRSGSQIGYQVRTFNSVLLTIDIFGSHGPVLRMKTSAGSQPMGENRSTLF
jgi:hypothetical protein